MKKHFLLWSIVMLSVLAITSCSKSSNMSELLDRVPDDVDVVAVADLQTIIESAGGSIEDSKIKLPSFIVDELSKSEVNDLDKANDFLKDAGINPTACAIAGKYKDSKPVIIFSLTDVKKFKNAIEDEGYKEKSDDDDIVIYEKKVYESSYSSDSDCYSYIGVSGSYAYYVENVWVSWGFNAPRAIKRMINDAAEAPFSKTAFADYITSGNAVGAAVRLPKEVRSELKEDGVSSSIANLLDGVMCLKGSLDADQATLDYKWLDDEGKAKDLKALEKFINLNAKIDPDALAYLGKNESLVFATSLKDIDWDEYLDAMSEIAHMSRSDKAALAVAKSYLEKIDGTITYGVGLTNGLESIINMDKKNSPQSEISTTMVISTKDGKAKSLINDLKSLLDTTGIPYDATSNGFNIDLPFAGTMVYAQADGNYLAFSNHKISKGKENPAVKSFNFSDYLFAMVLSLDKDNKLLKDLKVDNDICLSVATEGNLEMTAKLQVKGGKDNGIIAKVARIVIDAKNQIEKNYAEPEPDDYYYDEFESDDWAAADSAVAG